MTWQRTISRGDSLEYRVACSLDEAQDQLLALAAAKVVAVDIETTGLDPHRDRVRLIQLATPGMPVLVIDCFAFLPQGAESLRAALAGAGVKVFHNAKFDLQFLLALGIEVAHVFDTMLAAQLLRTSGGPERANLAAVCRHYLQEDINKEEQRSDWSATLTGEQLAYAAKDAEVLLRLREAMIPLIYANGLSAVAKAEFSCVLAIAHMEYHGIYLDLTRWQALLERTEVLRDQALEKLYAFSGRPNYQLTLWGEEVTTGDSNFDSNAYVLRLLKENGIVVPSTSKQHLSLFMRHPLVQALSDYRKHAKALSSFLYPIPSMVHPMTGRVHPRYGQIGAWSGRMSCGGPNIQQIPRDAAFRHCFRAEEGNALVIADYSQIELRVAAQIAGDGRMAEAYRIGEDIHRLTASLISDIPMESVTKAQRQAAKAVNFGLIYGMGAAGLQQYAQLSYGVEMPLAQAERFRDRFFRAYPGIAAWHQRIRDARPTEQRSLMGRRFTFKRDSGLSGLYNTPVQGTAADIAKAALGMLAQRLHGTHVRIIATVHDEILLESRADHANEVAALLKETMEQAGNTVLAGIPCIADAVVTDSWDGK